jgi:hypothetical protein
VTAIGIKAAVHFSRDEKLTLRFPLSPAEVLVPFKDLPFRSRLSPKTTFESVMDSDRVTALRHGNSRAEMILTRIEDSESIDAMDEDASTCDQIGLHGCHGFHSTQRDCWRSGAKT